MQVIGFDRAHVDKRLRQRGDRPVQLSMQHISEVKNDSERLSQSRWIARCARVIMCMRFNLGGDMMYCTVRGNY